MSNLPCLVDQRPHETFLWVCFRELNWVASSWEQHQSLTSIAHAIKSVDVTGEFDCSGMERHELREVKIITRETSDGTPLGHLPSIASNSLLEDEDFGWTPRIS